MCPIISENIPQGSFLSRKRNICRFLYYYLFPLQSEHTMLHYFQLWDNNHLRLSIDPTTDPSLKSIKDDSCTRIKQRNTSSENKQKFFETKPCQIIGWYTLCLNCSSFAKKSLFLFGFICLFTLWVLLNCCILSYFYLWKLGVA